MSEFEGFKSVEELKADAYASQGWTPVAETTAAELLERIAVPGQQFFARMAEMQYRGRPAEMESFPVEAPDFMIARGLAKIQNGSRPGKTFRVNADGHLLVSNPVGSGMTPVSPTEFVFGGDYLTLTGWLRETDGGTATELFLRYRDEIFDAVVAGMARALRDEAARRFLGR